MADESNANVKEQIEKLIRLQEVDAEIYDLEEKKEYFPARISEIDSSLETRTSGITAAEEELKKIQVEKNDKENQIKGKEEQIAKHEADLNQIKTNKEYKALLDEINNIKADISVIEDGVIAILDRIDEAQAKIEEEKKIFDEEKAKTDKEKEIIKAEEKEVDARLSELTGKREGFLQGVDKEILATYERIRENRGKIAIAKINGSLCGECNMTLRPQVINEAKMKKKITFCETCSRILYAEE